MENFQKASQLGHNIIVDKFGQIGEFIILKQEEIYFQSKTNNIGKVLQNIKTQGILFAKLMAESTSKMLSLDYIKRAIQLPGQMLFCKDLHPGTTCEHKLVDQFISGCKSVSKMYVIVHLVPLLLFKRKKLKQNPKKEIIKLLIAFLKSMIFAGGYSALVRYQVCWWTMLRNYDSLSSFFVAITSGITLIFQPQGRQSQIALFCLNKSLQTSYNMALRRKLPVRIPYGQCLLMGVSMAIICYHYFNNKDSIRQNYRKMVDKILINS